MSQDQRELMRAAGFSDAEIDAELGPARPTVRRAAAESTTMQGPGKAPARASQDLAFVKGVARQGAQGATLGFADEAEAGLRSLAKGGKYKELRDAIRQQNAAFAAENPGTALAANVAGGLLTGGVASAAAQGAGALGTAARVLAPRVNAGASVGQRIAQAARVGGVTGAIGGAGVANEMEDVPGDVFTGAAVGALAGGTLAGAGEALRGARNVAAQAGQNGTVQGPIRRAIQAETPEQAGARRVLRAAQRGGQSLDDLAAASEAAPAPAGLFEVMNDEQGTRLARIMRNTGRRRDATDAALAERSAETPAMWSRTVSRETGLPAPRDAQAVMQEARREAVDASSPLFAQANALPDVTDDTVGEVVNTLGAMREFGPRAVRRAETLATARGDTFPRQFVQEAVPDQPSAILGPDGLPARITLGTPAQPAPVPVRNVLDLRRGLDEVIGEMDAQGESPAILRELQGMRARIDAIAKGAGDVVRAADAAYAGPMARGESFALGQRVEQAGTPEGVQMLANEARDPEAFRQGAASRLLERAAGTADGEAGQTRNVVQGPLGSETRRARTRAAFPDDASFDRARQDAQQIVQYLRSQRAISGNSATAANFQEIADEFGVDVGTIMENAASPGRLALALFKDRGRALAAGTSAAQADEAGRLLFAGLPGFGSRGEAVNRLRALEPEIAALMARQATIRGALGGATGRAIPGGQ
jgi:hypothetical protein